MKYRYVCIILCFQMPADVICIPYSSASLQSTTIFCSHKLFGVEKHEQPESNKKSTAICYGVS